MENKEGEPIWVSLSLYPIKDSKGHLTEGRFMALDITEQKKNQKRLKKQNKDIQELLNATKSILKYRNFKKSAREIFNSCKEVTGAQSGYVALLSEDGAENELLFLSTESTDSISYLSSKQALNYSTIPVHRRQYPQPFASH